MFNLRRLFLLDRSITFLNHGSFGATPRPVFQAYQHWQRQLELQPVEFLGRRSQDLLASARAVLGQYLGSAADNLVFTSNVTVALNIVARSLDLGPGDDVLSTDHEYGALDRTWRFLAQQRGFRYITQPIPVPFDTTQNFITALWTGVTPHTRVIFLSHLTSPTALHFPVEQVIKRARAEGIITIVDGAHAPGQIPLDLDAMGADFYGGNLHKWLCAPKGAGFLYARPAMQRLLKPLVVSWGYEAEQPGSSRFVDHHEWWGTRDLAAFLSVPEAIRFQEEHDWSRVRLACHDLLVEAVCEVVTLSGAARLSDSHWFKQFASAPLPDGLDLAVIKNTLYSDYQIEVPLIQWNKRNFVRISIQGYNTRQDVRKLVKALSALGIVKANMCPS